MNTKFLTPEARKTGAVTRNVERIIELFTTHCLNNSERFIAAIPAIACDQIHYEPTVAFAEAALTFWGCCDFKIKQEPATIYHNILFTFSIVDEITGKEEQNVMMLPHENFPNDSTQRRAAIALMKARRIAILNFLPENYLADAFNAAVALHLNMLL